MFFCTFPSITCNIQERCKLLYFFIARLSCRCLCWWLLASHDFFEGAIDGALYQDNEASIAHGEPGIKNFKYSEHRLLIDDLSPHKA